MLEAVCADTGKHFLTDAPYGLGLISPIYVDVAERKVLPSSAPEWYRRVTKKAYCNAAETELTIAVTRQHETKRICFVNALMPYFGDSVSLLFRIDELKDCGLDVVVLIPTSVRLFVPEWVAEIWEVTGVRTAGIRDAHSWNLWLVRKIRELVHGKEACYVPHTFQPAAISRSSVARFTGVQPFDRSQWRKRQPFMVGFLWREDRFIPPERKLSPVVVHRLDVLGLRAVGRWLDSWLYKMARRRHMSYLETVETKLRETFPSFRMVVIGCGKRSPFQGKIEDRRCESFSEEEDRETMSWASQCHVLISAHGSHFVPLSCLPGSFIQMFPERKWANFYDGIVQTETGVREAIAVQRALPDTTTASSLAAVVAALLSCYPVYHFAYSGRYAGVLSSEDVSRIRTALSSPDGNLDT